MARFFHPLLTLIASSTDRELAKYVQFLKEENKILRKRIKGAVTAEAVSRPSTTGTPPFPQAITLIALWCHLNPHLPNAI